MTQKELKEQIKLVPRFKEVCCSRMCDSWDGCKDKDEERFLSCPWFFGYRIEGWPVKHLVDYSYNAPKFPDLRVEYVSDEFIKDWKERRSKPMTEKPNKGTVVKKKTAAKK